MNIETFFAYNKGNKFIEVFVNNDIKAMTLNELKKVKTTFNVTGNDKVYKIECGKVIHVA